MKRIHIVGMGIALTAFSMNALADTEAPKVVMTGHQTVLKQPVTVSIPAPAQEEPAAQEPAKPAQREMRPKTGASPRVYKIFCRIDNVTPVSGVRVVMQGVQGNPEITIDRAAAHNAVNLAKGHHRVYYKGPITANAKLLFYPAASGQYVVSNCVMKAERKPTY